MPVRIFYAWQSDRPSRTHKQFIRSVLDDVVKQLQEGSEVAEADRPEVEVDQDTQGEVGLVNVFASIQKKITTSDIFVCDLTHVCEYKHPDGRTKRAQNGNVLIELGFAMRNIDHRRIICVMNTKHGGGTGLPFDLNLYRHPVGYELGQNATDDDVLVERAAMAERLKTALTTSMTALAADQAITAQAQVVDRIAHGRVNAASIRQKLKADIAANTLSHFDAGGPMITMTLVPLIEGQQFVFTKVVDSYRYLRPLSSDEGRIFNDVDSLGSRTVEGQKQIAVTRIFDDGHATAASAIDVRDYKGAPTLMWYWAELRLIEAVSGLVALSKANGIAGPWEVCVTVYNVKGMTFMTEMDMWRWGSDHQFQSDLIEPKPVTISEDMEGGQQSTAAALKPILDGIWRNYGFVRCLRFRDNGEYMFRDDGR